MRVRLNLARILIQPGPVQPGSVLLQLFAAMQ